MARADKKQSSKKNPPQQNKKKVAPLFRGPRRAESLARQLERDRERKWPLLKESAGEWLRLALALKATALIIESEALRIMNPSAFAQSRADIVRSKRVAEPAPDDGGDDS